jgi:hypothetical protein
MRAKNAFPLLSFKFQGEIFCAGGKAASGGGAMEGSPVAQAGGGGGGRCGNHQGKCRVCREERADGSTAGQQADDAVEQCRRDEWGRQRQRVSAPQRGRKNVRAQPQVQGMRWLRHL